ncbi:MAG TPA: hypothetical protein VM492_17740 [Sumerlaeia bacterium]|nr:hypothetical protein [Sumerlaeia bacterium]
MTTRRRASGAGGLRTALDALQRVFKTRCLSPDPIEIVHEWRTPGDRKAVAFAGHGDRVAALC